MKRQGNILSRIFGEKRAVQEAPLNAFGIPYGIFTPSSTIQANMRLSAVYRCVQVISDSIACEDWDVMQMTPSGWKKDNTHEISYLLNNLPEGAVSKYDFFKTLVSGMLLRGNGYAHIIRNKNGNPIHLQLITEDVTMKQRTNGSIFYEVDGMKGVIESEDMIHVLNFTYDGITGVSTLLHATNSTNISHSAENASKGFFSSGANASGVIKSPTKLDKTKADAIKQAWRDSISGSDGTGGGVAVLEGGLDFTPISVNPKDAQMLETRQFNILEICRFFGVPPIKVFDNSNQTYSNVEAFQLSFVSDTIVPLNKKIESEINRKLMRPSLRKNIRVQLNTENLLFTNLDAKANYLTKLFQSGGYTVNEVRRAVGNEEYKDGNADIPFVQVNMQPVSKDFNKTNK